MSEQKYIQEFIASSWKAWCTALALGIIAGIFAAETLKPTYIGSVTFQIDRTPSVTQQNTSFYVYDNFYNTQTAQLARNNFAAWLTSPRVIYDIYNKAGLAGSVKASDNLTSYLRVKSGESVGNNTVTATYEMGSSDNANKLGNEVVAMAKSYHEDGISITSSDPLVMTSAPKKALVAGAIAIAVTFAAFFVTLVMHYLRPEKQ